MSAVEIRADLIERITKMDERFLQAMYMVVVAYDNRNEIEKPIGYDIDGNPKYASIMKAIYDKEVQAAREKGQFVTIEDLEKEMETW